MEINSMLETFKQIEKLGFEESNKLPPFTSYKIGKCLLTFYPSFIHDEDLWTFRIKKTTIVLRDDKVVQFVNDLINGTSIPAAYRNTLS